MPAEEINMLKSLKTLTVFELTFITILGVTIGAIFWTWTFVTSFISPFLEVFGLSYIFISLWMLSAVFPAYIVRKPGVALLSSLIAAFIEGLLSKWGIMALAWGGVQGLFAEIGFALFLYRRWDYKSLTLSIFLASYSGYFMDFFLRKYYLLSSTIWVTQLLTILISIPLFCLLPTLILTKKLYKNGLLNSFKISEIKEL